MIFRIFKAFQFNRLPSCYHAHSKACKDSCLCRYSVEVALVKLQLLRSTRDDGGVQPATTWKDLQPWRSSIPNKSLPFNAVAFFLMRPGLTNIHHPMLQYASYIFTLFQILSCGKPLITSGFAGRDLESADCWSHTMKLRYSWAPTYLPQFRKITTMNQRGAEWRMWWRFLLMCKFKKKDINSRSGMCVFTCCIYILHKGHLGHVAASIS